jgi:hypothetical protein
MARRFAVSAGGFGSIFQPAYGPSKIAGVGAFFDVRLSRWVQIEGEGRWLRFHEAQEIYQDNYLIGPRVPLIQFGRITPYAKVLVGFSNMNFQYSYAHGKFTDIAYGGGADIKLTRRLSARGDFEYQQWPQFVDGSLYPYGVSAGFEYHILGRR